jgi:hypothetical protein
MIPDRNIMSCSHHTKTPETVELNYSGIVLESGMCNVCNNKHMYYKPPKNIGINGYFSYFLTSDISTGTLSEYDNDITEYLDNLPIHNIQFSLEEMKKKISEISRIMIKEEQLDEIPENPEFVARVVEKVSAEVNKPIFKELESSAKTKNPKGNELVIDDESRRRVLKNARKYIEMMNKRQLLEGCDPE